MCWGSCLAIVITNCHRRLRCRDHSLASIWLLKLGSDPNVLELTFSVHPTHTHDVDTSASGAIDEACDADAETTDHKSIVSNMAAETSRHGSGATSNAGLDGQEGTYGYGVYEHGRTVDDR